MREHEAGRLRILAVIAALLLSSCGGTWIDYPLETGTLDIRPLFATGPESGCLFASPLLVRSRGREFVLTTRSDGTLVAHDPDTGRAQWSVLLPVASGLKPLVVATPVVVKESLVVAYQLWDPQISDDPLGKEPARVAHLVAVVDLERRTVDRRFELLTLAATVAGNDGRAVSFDASKSLSRAALKVLTSPRGEPLVYVSFGNKGDIQPWHGWVFEVNLDAWARGVAGAVTAVLLTTPETNCGEAGTSGMRDQICGGGVWAAPGPTAVDREGRRELFVATGNGQLDVPRRDYANAILRVGAGLRFDPGCDRRLCANFNPAAPSEACAASCKHLFIPRLAPGDPPLDPPGRICRGRTLLECMARLDYDFGASTPAFVQMTDDLAVLIQPAKDGHVYLIDANHLGTLYQRLKIVDVCGTEEDDCEIDWTGMIVAEPAVATLGDRRIAMVPTFVYDRTHPAGVVAMTLELDEGGPRLELLWQAPPFDTERARLRFRAHTSRLALMEVGGTPYVWVVDVKGFRGEDRDNDRRLGSGGWLVGIRVADGEMSSVRLRGRGQRFSQPLVHGNRVYVPSCDSDSGPSTLEAFTATPRRLDDRSTPGPPRAR